MVSALAPFVALAEAGLAVWLLHHPAKGEPPLGQAARGSGALLASVDIFLEMRHPGGNPFTRRRKLFGWSRHEETPRELLIELGPDDLNRPAFDRAMTRQHGLFQRRGGAFSTRSIELSPCSHDTPCR